MEKNWKTIRNHKKPLSTVARPLRPSPICKIGFQEIHFEVGGLLLQTYKVGEIWFNLACQKVLCSTKITIHQLKYQSSVKSKIYKDKSVKFSR